MVEVNLKRTFSSGEWEEGAAIKDNVIIVENMGIWPSFAVWVRSPVGSGSVVEGEAPGMCDLLNIKLQQNQTKRKREKLYSYKLLTSLI